jgi:N-acetylmuramic acid 6-phosphate etherase
MPNHDISTTMLATLATERRNPASRAIDRVSTREMVAIINAEDARVAPAVGEYLDEIARAIDTIVERIGRGGRLIYIGAGTSGRLGVLDASECPPTFNTDPSLVIGLIAGGDHALRHSIEGAEDRPEQGEEALRDAGVRDLDTVCGIAASGRTPYVIGALAYAKSIGAATIGIANTANPAFAPHADIVIAPQPGPEVVTGSTRMKAGTAQKLVLNMLSTGTMIRLGKTWGNLMVDVRPSNAKLQTRAIHIVEEATGLDTASARGLLELAENDVKTAIVMHLAGVDAGEASRRLASSGGTVAGALAAQESGS